MNPEDHDIKSSNPDSKGQWLVRVDLAKIAEMRRQNVNPELILTYLFLCGHARNHDHCWPSNAKLAEEAGKSERTISRHIGELRKLGVIFDSYPDPDRPYFRVIHMASRLDPLPVSGRPESDDPTSCVSTPLVTDDYPPTSSMTTPPSHGCLYNKDEVNKDTKNNSPLTPLKGSDRNPGEMGGAVDLDSLSQGTQDRKKGGRKELSPRALEFVENYFGPDIRQELSSRQSALIETAGSVLAAHAAINAVAKVRGVVGSPVGLMFFKAGLFAKEGVPAEMIATEDMALAGIEGR